jgi:nucleoside phosphorylase
MAKKSSKKQPKLKAALKQSQYTDILDKTATETLWLLVHRLRLYFYYWHGEPTEERILSIQNSFPLLNELISFKVVIERLNNLQDFEHTKYGVDIFVFFPELKEVFKEAVLNIEQRPQGLQKSESWLLAIAEDSGADPEIEAAIYLISRGHGDRVDVDTIRDSWHAAVCYNVKHAGGGLDEVPKEVLERAESKTISLSEAAKVLDSKRFAYYRFFSFRDEEEDFIDPAMFRAVEWLSIKGFEPWLKKMIVDLSRGSQDGISHIPASWWLFFWCRSDLAIRMAERHGLESWLWALINGPIDQDYPWRRFWAANENPRYRDYVPMAGIILYIWHRIKPVNMSQEVLKRATELLFQTQMLNGAWPQHDDDSEPSLIGTCFAIHGLALHQPSGWETSISRASQWLWKEQQPGGYWSENNGPTVMLTVLVLDSIALAEGRKEVTFNVGESFERTTTGSVTVERQSNNMKIDPEYDFSKESWFVSGVPDIKSVAIKSAHEIADPQIAIIVATEVELKYALAALSPLPRYRKIWKVTQGSDTYYLGKFGEFQCVLMLSSMSSQGPTGSTLSANEVLHEWNPSAALLIGIAFGAVKGKQLPADVLVSDQVIPYELQRVGEKLVFRNPVPPSSPALVNRFKHALDWTFKRPDGSLCSKHIGPLLSGDKLIDNIEFKDSLFTEYPTAIGGEMEGAGFWAAADRARTHWIIVKSVCDWADGEKHKSYQPMAAASAVSLSLHVFSDPHALDGL